MLRDIENRIDMKMCKGISKNGKPCEREDGHISHCTNSFCPVCGINPAKSLISQAQDGKRINRICTECTTAKNRLRRFGLDAPAIRRMLQAQSYKCLWCGKPLGNKYAVDHNHMTQDVRGLVHIPCNQEIAYYEKFRLLREHEITAKDLYCASKSIENAKSVV